MPDRRILWEQVREQKVVAEAADRLYQEKAAKHVALQMETVTGHEGWDVYVAHLNALRETWKGHEQRHIDALTVRFLTPEEYGKTRVDQAYARGRHEGFAEAIQIVKDLIARGTPPQEPPDAV